MVLKIGADDRLAVADVVEAMGIEPVSVDTSLTANRKPYPDRWVQGRRPQNNPPAILWMFEVHIRLAVQSSKDNGATVSYS